MSKQETTREYFTRALAHITPPEPMSTAKWIRNNWRSPEGKAFVESEVPWVTAPGGPCEAIDNPQYNTLYLQWSARCFKTTFAQAVQCKYADVDPCEMMTVAPDELTIKSVFGRHWKMLARIPGVRRQVPPERERNSTHIKLEHCQIHGGWPLGKSRLADKAIKVGHAGEVDKWSVHSTSTEGDPMSRFLKRGAQFADRKFIIESTPGQQGVSRVERGRLRGTNHAYWVPCPHCERFQQLIFCSECKGHGCDRCGMSDYGMRWDRDEAGRNCPDVALATARYVCKFCREDFTDEDRAWSFNQGVWVPEGCGVDDAIAMNARDLPEGSTSYLTGTMARDSVEYSSHHSILYALITSWGEIARNYGVKSSNELERRQFVTEDLGWTWFEKNNATDWEKLGERIVTPTMQGLVPEGFSTITIGVDKQADTNAFPYPYTVTAWDQRKRCHVIDYGFAETTEELEEIINAEWPHEDGGVPVKASIVMVDSGHKPKEVAEFVIHCARMRKAGKMTAVVKMVKGSSTKLNTMFRAQKLGKDTATPGMELFHVDSLTTQDWASTVTSVLTHEDDESLGVFHARRDDHEDFLRQVTNERMVTKPSGGVAWERADGDAPNDLRDTLRYNRVAIDVITRRGPVKPRRANKIHKPKRKPRDERDRKFRKLNRRSR